MGEEGAPTHPLCLVFTIGTEFPIYHGVVSINYMGDEKPGRVKAASILPFWYLPEYSCRVLLCFAQACNDKRGFFCGSSDFLYHESLLPQRDVSRSALLQSGERKGLSCSCRIQRAFASCQCFPQSLQHWKMLASKALTGSVTDQC